MNTKLILFIVIAIIYLFVVPYTKMWDDDSGWKTFCIKILPTRGVILLILYLIIFF